MVDHLISLQLLNSNVEQGETGFKTQRSQNASSNQMFRQKEIFLKVVNAKKKSGKCFSEGILKVS